MIFHHRQWSQAFFIIAQVFSSYSERASSDNFHSIGAVNPNQTNRIFQILWSSIGSFQRIFRFKLCCFGFNIAQKRLYLGHSINEFTSIWIFEIHKGNHHVAWRCFPWIYLSIHTISVNFYSKYYGFLSCTTIYCRASPSWSRIIHVYQSILQWAIVVMLSIFRKNYW